MKQVIHLIFIVISLGIVASCKTANKVEHNNRLDCFTNQYCIADVMGDQALDTVMSTTHPEIKTRKIVSVLKNGKLNKICEVKLDVDNFETFFIDCNNPGTYNKGLRLMKRNTRFLPDYDYVDIIYNRDWFIEKVGKINTNNGGHLESCVAKLSGSLQEFAEKDDKGNITVISLNNLTINQVALDSWDCN